MRIGATKTAPGKTESPEPQVVNKLQRLRIQINQISKVSDHARSKNKNTMIICSKISGMDQKSVKKSLSLVNANNSPSWK